MFASASISTMASGEVSTRVPVALLALPQGGFGALALGQLEAERWFALRSSPVRSSTLALEPVLGRLQLVPHCLELAVLSQ